MGAHATGKVRGPALDFDATPRAQRGEAVLELGMVEQHDLAAEKGELRRHGATAIAGADDRVAG